MNALQTPNFPPVVQGYFPVVDPNLYPWKERKMHIFAALCGQRSVSRQLSLFPVEAPEDSDVFLQSPSNDLGILEPSALSSLVQVPNCTVVQSDSRDFNDLLHKPTLDARLQPAFQTASVSYINDIQPKPEIPGVVTPVRNDGGQTVKAVVCSLPPEAKALPLDWLLGPKVRSPLDYVLAGLVRVEAHARKDGDVWFAEDCRQTWIALYKTFVKQEYASYKEAEMMTACQMFGCHQSQLQERIVANRKARLGKEYFDWFDSRDLLRPDINLPNKPTLASTFGGSAEPNGAEDTPIVAQSDSAPSPSKEIA